MFNKLRLFLKGKSTQVEKKNSKEWGENLKIVVIKWINAMKDIVKLWLK